MDIIYNHYHTLHAPETLLRENYPFETDDYLARAELILAAVHAAALGPIREPEEHGLAPILAVHDADFVEHLRTLYTAHAALTGKPEPVIAYTFATRYAGPKPQGLRAQIGYYAFGVDNPLMEQTWDAVYWSVQTALTAADCLLRGDRSAYALCRPPGHHAGREMYGGYCYLNNAASAARYLATQPPAGGRVASGRVADGRVAVLDVDFHHGNGTQDIFYNDPTVLFCSLHGDPNREYPFFWGHASERGVGAGLGTNHNFPLPRGTGDAAYLATLAEALAVIRDFAPRYLVVSLGLDIAEGDKVGGFAITREGFARIGAAIAALEIPTLIIQEGGYRLDTLGQNIIAFLQAFE